MWCLSAPFVELLRIQDCFRTFRTRFQTQNMGTGGKKTTRLPSTPQLSFAVEEARRLVWISIGVKSCPELTKRFAGLLVNPEIPAIDGTRIPK